MCRYYGPMRWERSYFGAGESAESVYENKRKNGCGDKSNSRMALREQLKCAKIHSRSTWHGENNSDK